jgi:integrase
MARSRNSAPTGARTQLGPFWLWYRAQRNDWCICWYDDGGGSGSRRTCRLATGIGGGETGQPPQEAQDRLVSHYEAWRKPTLETPKAALVEAIMADWLIEHAEKHLADPTRYANSIDHWLRFFSEERRAGRLTGAPVVSDMRNALIQRFIDMRRVEGASAHTISRDLAGLRQPLNWAWKVAERIESAPFIQDIKDKPEGKTLVYSPQQIAALLDAALAAPEREHIAMVAMIALSTHGRLEAILELDEGLGQVQDGLIFFNQPNRAQTKKRRSIVPIAPTLAPWLRGVTGRIVKAKRLRTDPATGEPVYICEPVASIKKAFEGCLLAAGISEIALGGDGEPVWLPPRKRIGESKPRLKLVGLGSPNTLRHTCSTEMHRRGVPEAQIDAAAGHGGKGTNAKHYRHLRPDYLQDFIAGVEAFWVEVGKHTDAHLRYHRDTKIIDIGARRPARGKKIG